MAKFEKVIVENRPRLNDIRIALTVTGKVECAPDFSVKEYEDDHILGNGFGPFGMFPAALIIKAIDETTVTEATKE